MEKFKEFVEKFTPYLEDIRQRLYVTAVIFMVFFGVGFFLTARIIKYLVSFFNIEGVVIATTSPFQFADLSINIGLMCAFLVTCPIFVYNIFAFLRPALSAKERGSILLFVPISIFLFIGGFSYGFIIMYYALIVLAEINIRIGIQNIWDVGMFLTQIVLTSALLGVLFQFPLIVTSLVKMSIVNIDFLRKKRRIAYFIIFIFTTLLPPTDGVSLLAMAAPLILLYEVTLLVNSRAKKEIIIHF